MYPIRVHEPYKRERESYVYFVNYIYVVKHKLKGPRLDNCFLQTFLCME
jgi:hypothetical protein